MIIFSSVICLFGGNVAGMSACRSRTNADDRLPADTLGRVEGGDGSVEFRDGADVRAHASVSVFCTLRDRPPLICAFATTAITAEMPAKLIPTTPAVFMTLFLIQTCSAERIDITCLTADRIGFKPHPSSRWLGD